MSSPSARARGEVSLSRRVDDRCRHGARARGIIMFVVGVRVRPAHEQIHRPWWTNGPENSYFERSGAQ